MRYVISEIQSRLWEQEEKGLSPVEVILFKKLNQEKEKGKLKTKPELKDYIKNISEYLGLPEKTEIYYTELYRKNYRKDGKYDEITKNDLIDPKDLPGLTISNTSADKYTSTQMPFRGTNLDGFWRADNKGVPMYVVLSYGWYPLYLFKNGVWYEVVERYSSSTGRQMSNASPFRYSEKLDSNVYWATPDEMKMLMRGTTHEEFLKNKIETFEKKAGEEISQRKRSMSSYEIGGGNHLKIKFKIKNLRKQGNRGVVDVDVYGVVDQRKNINIDYLNNKEGFNKEMVEKRLIGKLGRELEKYVGQVLHYYGDGYEPGKHLIDFNFNHISEIKK
jgi:hypothetical protein